MISKQSVIELVNSNANERELQKLIKRDLSLFAELYSRPSEDYICFSEFPIDDGFVDFAIFTGVSRMDIFLVEIKGANFYLSNKGHYDKFNERVETAVTQLRNRLGYIHRNLSQFRNFVHDIRENVLSGQNIYNSLLGPNKLLEVDRDKDINVYCIVIGGRTRDDFKESRKRQDYEFSFNLPIKIESWDTWLRKLRRR